METKSRYKVALAVTGIRQSVMVYVDADSIEQAINEATARLVKIDFADVEAVGVETVYRRESLEFG